MPRSTATVLLQEESSVAAHAAVRAWQNCGHSVPRSIEVLKPEKRKGGVYRLMGAGAQGLNVIAKKCDTETAAIEHLIYREVLPQLPLDPLRCYGSLQDDDARFSWIFLEDAGAGEYSPEIEEHRTLAGLWLGVMNLSARELPQASRLPDRGPDSYLEILQIARCLTREKLVHPGFSAGEREILRQIVSHCELLETEWRRVERFCSKMPRTLVHGDLSLWNARISENPTQRLLVMDWECAGWGVPAADLAQFTGNSLTPDLEAYFSVVHGCWPDLDLHDFERLANVGRVFRWINAVAWANWGFHDGAIRWYITEMGCYRPGIPEWALGTQALLELE